MLIWWIHKFEMVTFVKVSSPELVLELLLRTVSICKSTNLSIECACVELGGGGGGGVPDSM